MAPRGFTLIELMIAVAVAVGLALIAWPSYVQAVRKSHRQDAHEALARLMQAQEQWRASHLAYTQDLSQLGLPTTSPQGYYTLSLQGAGAAGYGLTFIATAQRGQDRDVGCTTLTAAVDAGQLLLQPTSCWAR